MKLRIYLMLLIVCILSNNAGVSKAAAASIAVTNISGGSFTSGYNLNIGWSFTLQNDIIVTSLGTYDYLNDGFTLPLDVGIFNSYNTLLVKESINSGSLLSDGFRYEDLTDSFSLVAGDYTISTYIPSG